MALRSLIFLIFHPSAISPDPVGDAGSEPPPYSVLSTRMKASKRRGKLASLAEPLHESHSSNGAGRSHIGRGRIRDLSYSFDSLAPTPSKPHPDFLDLDLLACSVKNVHQTLGWAPITSSRKALCMPTQPTHRGPHRGPHDQIH